MKIIRSTLFFSTFMQRLLARPERKILSVLLARGDKLFPRERKRCPWWRAEIIISTVKGRSVLFAYRCDEGAIYTSRFGRMCRRSTKVEWKKGEFALKKRRNRNLERGKTAAAKRLQAVAAWRPACCFEREKEGPVCAHSGFNACKTRGVHWRTRSTTPEVTKPLNYRLVPLSSSGAESAPTATARERETSGRYESRYLVSYSRGIWLKLMYLKDSTW